MSDTDRGAELSDIKKALLARRLKGKKSGTAPQTGIPPRSPDGPVPLSFGQQRLWFLQQMAPESCAYNMHSAFRVRGALRAEEVHRAFHAIAARHEILRTTFHLAEGGLVQEIAPEPAVQLEEVDLSGIAPDERLPHAVELAAKAAREPFDLAAGPLFRLHLYRLGEADALLLLSLHHIICDEPSIDRIWEAFGREYTALRGGDPAPPRPLKVQYADYAAWQRAGGAADENDLAYWQEQLEADIEPIRLPTDHPRPPVQTFDGAVREQTWPGELSGALEDLGSEQRATRFMVFLAGMAALQHRLTGQEDITIGIPVTLRDRPELEALVGFFLNTVVIRTRVQTGMTFRALLDRVRQQVLDGYAHRSLPFEKLVEVLDPQREPGHNPLFRVMVVPLSGPAEGVEIPGLDLAPVEIPFKASKFDLTLFVEARGDGLRVLLEYNSDLYEPETIQRTFSRLRSLLAAASRSPDEPLGRLELLSDDEASLLETFQNGEAVPEDFSLVVHDFEAHARRMPDRPALRIGEAVLTYGQLNRRANQVAHALIKRGLGPNGIVGLHLPHSPELFAAMLGILKAGGAYLPLDPAYPAERTAAMRADARVELLITGPNRAAQPEDGAQAILLDPGWAAVEAESGENPGVDIVPEQRAYLIYTSGSTGTPKGVMVTHANLAYSTGVRRSFYQESPSRVYLLLSSYAFDSSVAGIYWTLTQGGTLVVPRPEAAQDADALNALVAEHGVTHTLALPSLYAVMLETAEPGRLASLETVIVAGEASPPDLHLVHYRRLPDTKLYNEYGPTEGTVWASVYLFPNEAISGPVPIGRPIPNGVLYICDPQLNRTPIGVPGELLIGGPGVAAGYWERPELNEARFIDNPFGGGTLYRTGDLARFRADGQIEFLGRIDRQIKLRGHRIEPGEIEARLGSHPGVLEAAVVLHQPSGGEEDLAGRMAGLDPDQAEEIWRRVTGDG